MRRQRTLAGLAVGVAVALGTTGCQFDGLNSLPMPGSEGRMAGSYTVRIQMPNVTTLTRNSPVRVDDVAVGNVTGIDVEGWHALVTVSLNPDVRLPANAVAKIGQTSLLGSNHVELSPPTTAPSGQLRDGDVIPLERAGAYPTTEQVLSSLSVVLNGGGIAQLETITTELNAMLSGREDEIADLLPQLNELTTGLERQTGSIISAMEGLDHLAVKLAGQKDVIAEAIEQIHPALTVLADRSAEITRAITALGELGDVSERLIKTSGDDLVANLRSLGPVLQTLADTGNNLIQAMGILPTFPFPIRNIDNAIKGDYMNLFITFDLTGSRLDSNWLTGTPLGGRFGGVEGVVGSFAPSTATDAADPATAPFAAPPAPGPMPTIPGLPSIPGLPAIPGITAPLPGQEGAGR
ncbi:MCE family protein [Nocardia sp. FBN12]|uniref:MCE family protein n=1 Tax=Nocardia sp. FBN12 TaxID=3419766 RepID=UPI003D0640C1